MCSEAWPGSRQRRRQVWKCSPRAAVTPAQPHPTPQPSIGKAQPLDTGTGHPSPCFSPHPHTSSHFHTHAGAIPVTSLCTHIPVCTAPKPGSRLVRPTLGAAWPGWWLSVPCVSSLMTPFRHQHTPTSPHTAPELGGFLLLLSGGGRAGAPYFCSLMADHRPAGMARGFSPLLFLPPGGAPSVSSSPSVR